MASSKIITEDNFFSFQDGKNELTVIASGPVSMNKHSRYIIQIKELEGCAKDKKAGEQTLNVWLSDAQAMILKNALQDFLAR